MVGCGTQTTPEIIMPDQPMTSSVTEQTGSADADVQQDETEKTSSGTNYKVYLITMESMTA